MTLEAAATVRCRRTRWASTAALRLRHATVDLGDAVLEHPVSVCGHATPFTEDGRPLAEPGLTDPRVRAASLRGVDAAHLVLTDVDLTDCLFAGTVHLDQLRLDGLYRFATTPTGPRRGRWPPGPPLAGRAAVGLRAGRLSRGAGGGRSSRCGPYTGSSDRAAARR